MKKKLTKIQKKNIDTIFESFAEDGKINGKTKEEFIENLENQEIIDNYAGVDILKYIHKIIYNNGHFKKSKHDKNWWRRYDDLKGNLYENRTHDLIDSEMKILIMTDMIKNDKESEIKVIKLMRTDYQLDKYLPNYANMVRRIIRKGLYSTDEIKANDSDEDIENWFKEKLENRLGETEAHDRIDFATLEELKICTLVTLKALEKEIENPIDFSYVACYFLNGTERSSLTVKSEFYFEAIERIFKLENLQYDKEEFEKLKIRLNKKVTECNFDVDKIDIKEYFEGEK